MMAATTRLADVRQRVRTATGGSRGWRIGFAAIYLAEALMLVVVGRRQWWFFDEWRLFVERVAIDTQGPIAWFRVLFRPDGEHVIGVPLALFVVVARWSGLDTFWPVIVVNVAIRLGTMWAADQIALRFGVGRLPRLLALAGIAFLGVGYESLFGQSLMFAGITLLCCLLAIRSIVPALEGSTTVRSWQVGLIAGVWLAIAALSSSYAFPVVAGVAIALALARRPLDASIALVLPIATFFVVRRLAGGAYAPQQPATLDQLPLYTDYVQVGLTTVGEGLTGWDGTGMLSFAAIAAAVLWLTPPGPTRRLAIAMLLTVPGFYLQASLSRSVFGADQANAPRYAFFCGALLIVAMAVAWGARRVPRRAVPVVTALLVISGANAAGLLVHGENVYTSAMQQSKARLGLTLAAAATEDYTDFRADIENAPDLSEDRLRVMVEWSGSDAFIAEGQRCYQQRLEELRAAAAPVAELSPRDRIALTLLLHERFLVAAPPGGSLPELVATAATGEGSSFTLDQFRGEFAALTVPLAAANGPLDVRACP